MPGRILALFEKECRHIVRDPRTLAIIVLMPIMMVILYGYALNMDVQHIPIAILDRDGTPASRRVIDAFSASRYFAIERRLASQDEVPQLFAAGTVKAVIIIPRNFGADLESGVSAPVQLLVDGSDPLYGNAATNYATTILTTVTPGTSPESQFPVDIRPRFLYNPELEGSTFIIPGLVAVILMMICALLTSITVAREKETGTMDMLMVSPVRPAEMLLGKVMPYLILALADGIFILAFAWVIFTIPLRGDLILLLGMSALFIYCALGIGLFISSVAPTQQVAMMVALVATIMPSIILSGFIFPIFSMPMVIRLATYIVPARYYLEIIRGILLKESTASMLADQALFLVTLGTLLTIAASVRFAGRKRQ